MDNLPALSLETPVLLIRHMAHDLRGLLSILTNTSDLFTQGAYGELSPKQVRACERIQRTSNRMLMLVDDLATYVKAEADQLPLTLAPFDPRALLMEIGAETRAAADAKALVQEWIITDALPSALIGDRGYVRRVILALVWNAVSFTTQGRVRLTATWSASGEWSVEVFNSGTVIPAADAPHLFEPFWQGPAGSQVPTSGCGLGLAQAQALTKLMRGRLQLADTGAEGTTFQFTIRLDPADIPPASPLSPTDPQRASRESEG